MTFQGQPAVGDLAVTACPPFIGGTEPLSSCTVPASMTRASTCGETPVGWAKGNVGHGVTFSSWVLRSESLLRVFS